MQYPLELCYKTTGNEPQVSVADATGNLILIMNHSPSQNGSTVLVYADAELSALRYTISPDWILDFSAQYHFTDHDGQMLGSVRRDGERSLWRTRFEIMNGGPPNLQIREESSLAKFMDAIMGEIPLVGAIIPRLVYLVNAEDGATLVRIEKQKKLFESRFKIEKQSDIDRSEETRILLSLLILVLMEQVAL
ncbi:MAG: hypothetical protein BMS9Abin28_2462 [Anaerolineae bacterium]|nr:MAG: hypothetical protein BMS9Abin28_2462 [Anaerolineae bacterium]